MESKSAPNTDTKYLVSIQLHIYQWYPLVHLIIMFDDTVNSFRDIFKYQIEIKFILFSCREEAVLQGHNIWMVEKAHGLQLSVLIPLVLENLFYSNCFTILQTFCLDYHKGLTSNDVAVVLANNIHNTVVFSTCNSKAIKYLT